MAGRPRTRSDEEVLAATLRAVGRHGVSRLTLAHVAAEAGLAPSTLAERFGSKRELLLAATRATVGGVGATFADATQSAPAPLAAAVCALVALAAPVGSREAFARHLAVLELDVADPDFRAVAAEHHAAARAALAGLLAAAVEDGTLLPAARPDRLARALHNAYQGALISWAVSGEGSLEAALRDDLEAVLEPWRA